MRAREKAERERESFVRRDVPICIWGAVAQHAAPETRGKGLRGPLVLAAKHTKCVRTWEPCANWHFKP